MTCMPWRFAASFFVFLLVLCAASPVGAQEGLPAAPAPNAIQLPSDWKPGETYRLEIIRERLALEDGRQSPLSRTTAVVTVAVKEKNEEGYVLIWGYGETKAETANPAQNAVFHRMQTVNNGMRYEMQTDAAGLPRRLLNLDTAVAAFRRVADEAAALMQQSGSPIPSSTLEQLTRADVVQASVLRDPQMFYFLSGATVEPGVTIEYADTLPNPFGGDPFPSNTRIALQESNPETNEATILWSQDIDREKAWPLLRQALSRLMPDLAQDLPEQAQAQEIRVGDEGTYVMDTASGLPRTVTVQRTISVVGQGRIERTRIRVLPPEDAGPSLHLPPPPMQP